MHTAIAKDMLLEYHEVVPLIVCDGETAHPESVEASASPSIRISLGDIRLDVFRDADRTLIAETLMAVKSVC